MTKLFAFCLNNKFIVLLSGLVILLAGAYFGRELPVDVFPELKIPRVTVQTEATGLSAEEVEQYITIPLESAMNGTAGVKGVRSSSGSGLSFVWVDFDWDMDLYKARQIVSERISTVRDSLPPEYSAEITPIVSITGEIMLLALTGDEGVSPLEMRRVAEYSLRNRLLSIPGVGQVTVLGGRLPEYQILYTPEKLRAAGISFDDLKTAVERSQSTLPAGFLEEVAGQEIPLRQETRISDLDNIKRALIPDQASENVVRVDHVADVRIGGALRRGGASFEGKEAVVLSVQKAPGANTLALTEAVDKAVAEFSKSQLPKGMHISIDAYRQADFINLSLDNGVSIVLDAAFVVILVLFLTLLNARMTLITLLSMPLSIGLALIIFPIFDLAINIMTLGGLAVAVGDVVDNAIIFVEISWRRLQENAHLPKDQQLRPFDVLMKAKGEIIHSINFSTIIILLVFTPLLFLSGIEGQFFRPLGIAFMLALVCSLIVAVTITPVLCLISFKPKKTPVPEALSPYPPDSSSTDAETTETPAEEKASDLAEDKKPSHSKTLAIVKAETWTVRMIKRIYSPMLEFCIWRAKIVFSVMISITAAALYLASTFGTSFLPPFNEDCFTVFVSTVPGTSLDETQRIARQVMKNVEEIPGVVSVTQRAGRAENDEHAEPVSASEMLVRVDLSQDQKRIRQDIKSKIDNIPGTSTLIGYPLAHRISSALSGSASEIAINIYGNDLAQLRVAVAKAKDILKSLPEVADARANREIMVDSLKIDYNREALAAAGLTITEAAEQVSAAINGLKLGKVIKNQDRWNIVLRLEDDVRQNIDDVKRLELISPSTKRPIRLDQVANIYREETTNMILRDAGLRKAMISCNPSPDSNLGDLAAACRAKLDPAMNELGCTVDYAGTIKARESAATRLYLMGGGILLLIIALLAGALGNLRRALISLINIPLCLIGGILAVYIVAPTSWLTNLSSLWGAHNYIPPIISVSSIVGFVTVIGFAIRSGLIMLNYYKDLEAQGYSLDEALRRGSMERVVPIIMTSLTTILALLPIIWAIDRPGGELLGPLAIVQFGGLISATLLNLLILPATVKLFQPKIKKIEAIL